MADKFIARMGKARANNSIGREASLQARGFFGRAGAWVVCAMLLELTACVELPPEVVKQAEKPLLVYPLPPDEARFVYERTIRSNNDVSISATSSDITLKNFLTGENSSDIGFDPLKKPYTVSVNRGRIFVSDPVARSIKVFDMVEDRYFRIGEEEPGLLEKPIGIDTDAAGNLYVADATAKAIMVYDRDGKFLRKLAGAKIGEEPMFSRLASVTVDKNGEKIYAVDIGGSRSGPEAHRIRVFDAHNGKHLFDFGGRGSGPGQLNLPRDVAIGKNNELYVVDSGNFRIQVFDAEGKYLREFGKLGKQLGNLARPKEAATDAEGNLYVIDAIYGNFQIFTPQGDLLMFIGTQFGQDGPGHFKLPSGITVDEDGRIYVVDQLYRKIDIFRPAKLGEHDGYLGGKKPPAATVPTPPAVRVPVTPAVEKRKQAEDGQADKVAPGNDEL